MTGDVETHPIGERLKRLEDALRPMSDDAKTGETVLVYFERYGWLTVFWGSRFLEPHEVTPENGIWCLDDHKNDPWMLRGYSDGDDTHWMPRSVLPSPPSAKTRTNEHDTR